MKILKSKELEIVRVERPTPLPEIALLETSSVVCAEQACNRHTNRKDPAVAALGTDFRPTYIAFTGDFCIQVNRGNINNVFDDYPEVCNANGIIAAISLSKGIAYGTGISAFGVL